MSTTKSLLACVAATTILALSGCASDGGSEDAQDGTEEVGASEEAVTVAKCPKNYDLTFENLVIYGGFDHGGIDDDQIARVNAVRSVLRNTRTLSAKVRRVDARRSVCHYETLGKASIRLFTKAAADSLAVDVAVPNSQDEWIRIYVPVKKTATSYTTKSGTSVPLYAAAYYSGAEGAEGLKRIGQATLR